MTMDFLSETMAMRRKCQNILKVLTEKTINSELYTRNKGEIKDNMEFFGIMELFYILNTNVLHKCIHALKIYNTINQEVNFAVWGVP